MIQIKKTILTLVALLAVTTGAWADETPLLTIENKDYASFKSGSMTFDDMVTVTFSNEVKNYGSTTGWFSSTGSLLTVAGTNGYTITSCKFYTDAGIAAIGYTVEGESPSVFLSEGYVYTDNSKSVNIGEPGVKKIEVYGGVASSASSGPKVAWNKAKKTGKFTMPGGNVTLEPEYYPQATVADGGVTAADADARATTDDPLVKVDATKLTGAKKLMYFVSNSGTTAPAYDAEGWTDQLPTAKGFTQQGIVYVWYYPVGTDEGVDGATATYSDGDICLQSITARIAAEPTYAVTFAEGTDPNEWTASPKVDVKKGQTVTVTYTGSKKVIGVKAEKKAKAAATDLSTINANYTASDGELLTGTLAGNYKISIADGATVTLDGVTISNGQIACDGSVTMILMGANTVTATTEGEAAIKIGGSGTTLTITGSGSLTAQGGLEAAGIGTDRNENGELSFGNIVINGGTVTATGGKEGAGIGTGLADGQYASASITCGDITINGGTVTAIGGLYGAGIGTGPTMSDGGSASITCGDITINGGTVTATGGDFGPGIGTGVSLKYGYETASNRCGNITIGAGVTSVTATKGGSYSPNSIGKGYAQGGTQNYGTITIGGDATTYATGVTTSPFTYTPSN